MSKETIQLTRRNSADDLPPFSTEAEAGALGCIVSAESEQSRDMLSQLSLDDFYDVRHREVFRALGHLQIEGKPLNTVALAQFLQDNNQVEQVGGLVYVDKLPDLTPSPANFPTFLETVLDRSTRRAALKDSAELSRLATDLTIPAKALADAAGKLLEAHARNGNSKAVLPAIIDAAEFIATPHPEPAELVRGILHQGSKLVLGGGSKSCKTWMLLDLALSVAYGQPWLGFETNAGPVLFVNFEIQDYSWKRRLLTVAKAKRIELHPGRVQLLNLRGCASDFKTLLPQISRQAKVFEFVLIILDPIYKLYGRTDENKASDVAALLNGIESLAVDSGAAAAFGAHFSKGNQAGKEAIDRISGSGVFARDPDSILVFTRHEVEEAFGVECILRNFAPVEPFAVRWQFPLMQRADDLDPGKLKKAAGRTREHTPEALLEVLGNDSLTSTEWQTRAKEDTGTGNGTFYALLGQLQKSNRVTRGKINRKWLKAST